MIGFSDEEIAAIIRSVEKSLKSITGYTDENQTPRTLKRAISRPGDPWLLGEHRLLCGDATLPEDVAHLLGAAKPHLIVTDLPSDDGTADWRNAWTLFPGDVAYVWHSGIHSGMVSNSLLASGFEMRAQIIRVRNRPLKSRANYQCQHESCWYVVRKGRNANWTGNQVQTTVWSIDRKQTKILQGIQKPVETMRRPMENNSIAGDAVYDPFSGSGTTIIAAQTAGRNSVMPWKSIPLRWMWQ
uniref:DNA modification methylase n=1 Tax=Candidatus Kentrum sp. FW TaxID=2126338 RepID=A0A450TF65_9GAMM|nr:MAG: DNA modification methylase [Candidatus Kentron sp. FW]